jgi:hypothetical protein
VVQTPTGDVAMPAPAPIFAGVHRNYHPDDLWEAGDSLTADRK